MKLPKAVKHEYAAVIRGLADDVLAYVSEGQPGAGGDSRGGVMKATRPWSFLTFPVALVLWPIVLNDYHLRRIGIRPDRWHWADTAMFWLGWVAQ